MVLWLLKNCPDYCNPVNTKEVLSERLGKDGFLEFIDHLQKFGDLATRAIAASTEVEAAALWSNVYKHFFPLPESEVRMFCQSKQDSKILSVFTPNVFVEAERKKHIYNKKNQWSGYNQISLVPKNCSITFTLVNNDKLPHGARVEWTVRNEGHEAEKTNDLGHEAGTGSKVKESSAYKGCHYMDCIVRQHGHIISMRRIPVRIV